MIKSISGQIKAKTAFMDADRYGRSDTSAIGRWFWARIGRPMLPA